ncbi:MAG: sulfotransferase family protein [Thermoplasmatota archaeon]
MYSKIIAIVGVPRSGTSWLGQIIDSSPAVRYRYQPIFSYAFKDAVDEDSSKKEYQQFFEGIYTSDDDFLCQKERKEKGIYPTFEEKKEEPDNLAFKMVRYHHLVPDMLNYFDNLKGVGIIRHPCAVINSWLSTPKEFPDDADPKEEWRHGECRNKGHPEEYWGFEAWKEVTEMYMDLEEEYPDQFTIVKYENLVDNPFEETQELFDFLDLSYTDQTENFLRKSQERHDDDPYSVFRDKKVKEKWKWELDEEIKEEILSELNEFDIY